VLLLTTQSLKELLLMPESSTLDFKRQLYDFAGDAEKANASLVKDVCSMINTIRAQTSYIIFGVDSAQGNSPVVTGITNVIDDAILQDKVKTKILPRPAFSFYTVVHEGYTLGIMEFPLRKYSGPLMPVISMKGLIIDTVYYRQGSSNTIANTQEAIRIYEWLRGLPDEHSPHSMQNAIVDLLTELQDHSIPLSRSVSKMYGIGKKFHIQAFIEFAELELKGIGAAFFEKGELIQYRKQKVFLDIGGGIEINLNQFTTSEIKQAFRNEKHLVELDLQLDRSLNQMEAMMNDFEENKGKRLGTLNSSTQKIIPDYKGSDSFVRIYLFPDDLKTTLRSIRTKAIELVMAQM
jgi:hypothetical protein